MELDYARTCNTRLRTPKQKKESARHPASWISGVHLTYHSLLSHLRRTTMRCLNWTSNEGICHRLFHNDICSDRFGLSHRQPSARALRVSVRLAGHVGIHFRRGDHRQAGTNRVASVCSLESDICRSSMDVSDCATPSFRPSGYQNRQSLNEDWAI